MKPTDNMINQYDPAQVARFMATMAEQQRPSRLANAPIAHVNAPQAVAPVKAVQELTAAKLAAVEAFYLAGHTYAETAEKFGMSIWAIRGAMKKLGINAKRTIGRRVLTDVAVRTAYRSYTEGTSVIKLSEDYGVYRATLVNWFKRLELPFPLKREAKPRPKKVKAAKEAKPDGRLLEDDRIEQIADYYAAGHSASETAKAFGASLRTVRRCVVDMGGEVRSRARPQKFSDDEARAVHSRYVEGESLHSIAAETGMAYTTYAARFKRLGLPFPVKR